MKTLLKAAIAKERNFIKACKETDHRDNPQVIEMRMHSEGRLEALEAVLDAARGNLCYLRSMARTAE
jgi:hypothetical protein